MFCVDCKVRCVAEVIVCVNCLIYVILELHEIRLQGLAGYIKKQASC